MPKPESSKKISKAEEPIGFFCFGDFFFWIILIIFHIIKDICIWYFYQKIWSIYLKVMPLNYEFFCHYLRNCRICSLLSLFYRWKKWQWWTRCESAREAVIALIQLINGELIVCENKKYFCALIDTSHSKTAKYIVLGCRIIEKLSFWRSRKGLIIIESDFEINQQPYEENWSFWTNCS